MVHTVNTGVNSNQLHIQLTIVNQASNCALVL